MTKPDFYIIGGQRHVSPFDTTAILNQIQIADALPGELEQVKSDLEMYISHALDGKSSVPQGTELMHVRTYGPPGSGNTVLIKDLFDHLDPEDKRHSILSAYDENGAIEAITHFIEGLEKLKRKAAINSPEVYPETAYYYERLALRDRYRQASQIGRDLLLAVAREHNLHVFEDTTGSSPHTLAGYAQSRAEGRKGTTFVSYAPFELRLDRVLRRPRTVSMGEEFGKKAIAVYEKLPKVIADAAETGESLYFSFTQDGRKTDYAFVIKDGLMQHYDTRIVNQVSEALDGEISGLESLADHDDITASDYERGAWAVRKAQEAIRRLATAPSIQSEPTAQP